MPAATIGYVHRRQGIARRIAVICLVEFNESRSVSPHEGACDFVARTTARLSF
jgi:hypothetical protein